MNYSSTPATGLAVCYTDRDLEALVVSIGDHQLICFREIITSSLIRLTSWELFPMYACTGGVCTCLHCVSLWGVQYRHGDRTRHCAAQGRRWFVSSVLILSAETYILGNIKVPVYYTDIHLLAISYYFFIPFIFFSWPV